MAWPMEAARVLNPLDRRLYGGGGDGLRDGLFCMLVSWVGCIYVQTLR